MRGIFSSPQQSRSPKTFTDINGFSPSSFTGAGFDPQHNQENNQLVLFEADKLIRDIQAFLESVSSKSNQSVFSKLRQSVTVSSRKSHTPAQSYETLSKKLAASEVQLKKLTDDATSHQDALLHEGCEMYFKLSACVNYTISTAPQHELDLAMLKQLLVDIAAWIQYLQAMVKFHQEVIHQEQSQAFYIPRSSGGAVSPPNSSIKIERENDILMVNKLSRLKKVCFIHIEEYFITRRICSLLCQIS